MKEIYIKKIILLFKHKSLSYIELEEGKVNGSISKDEFDDSMISTNNSMGLICDVNDDAIVVKRISFEKNEFYGDDWIIDVPINKNNLKIFIWSNG